jgi:uncharacterized LabA/DUF88 family protein
MTGAILIDGHHVFLETLRDVTRFNAYAKRPPLADLLKRKMPTFGALPNIWDPITPQKIARLVGDELEWDLPRIVTLITPLEADANDICIVLCDAKLAARQKVIGDLEAQRSRIKRESGTISAQFDVKLDQVRKNKWSFYRDDEFVVLPYDFKNDFIDTLSSSSGKWAGRFGNRKIDVRPNGTVHDREKGVDTQLVIHGCEMAADPAIQWICIVTNDSDYAPLVHHMHRKAKSVYWLTYASRRSGDLLTAVGGSNVIELEQVRSGYHEADTFQHVREVTRAYGRKGSPMAKLFADDPAIENLYLKCCLEFGMQQLEKQFQEHRDELEKMRERDPIAYEKLMAKIEKESPF